MTYNKESSDLHGRKLPTRTHSTSESTSDNEMTKVNSSFPRPVLFIIGNEFCERFSYYGMRSKYNKKYPYLTLLLPVLSVNS